MNVQSIQVLVFGFISLVFASFSAEDSWIADSV